MLEVKTCPGFPDMEPLAAQPAHDDLLVCALGFEDRCTAGPSRLKRSCYKARRAIVLRYDVHERENSRNESRLLRILSHIVCEGIVDAEFSVRDPVRSHGSFAEALEPSRQGPPCKSVTVDITSFSSAAIVQILDTVLQLASRSGATVRVMYSEARTYFPLRRDRHKRMPEEVYLSSGVSATVVLPKFGGLFVPGFPTLLITYLGFDPIRLRGAVNLLQPARTIGIVGVPPRPSRRWRADEVRTRNAKIIPDDNSIAYLSTLYYQQTIVKLRQLYEQFSPDYNIALCPLGSKQQTLGVLLFAQGHRDVKLIFPIPVKFQPERYSKGYGKSWQLVLRPAAVPL